MKKALFLLLMVMLTCAVWSEGSKESATSTKASAEPVILKFSDSDGPQGARQKTAELFAKKVEEYTEGRYKVEIYHSGELASDTKAVQMLSLGSGIDVTVTATSGYSNYLKELDLASLPYLVDNYEQGCRNFTDNSTWMKQKFEELATKGIHILAMWEAGFRSFTTKREFKSLADVKDMKLRIFNNNMLLWTIQSFGMNPVVMTVNEAYLAIQQGVVEGQENPVDTIYSRKFYEVAPYITLSQHIYSPIPLSMSEKRWQTIPEKDQKGILKAAADSSAFIRQEVKSNDERLLKLMESQGAKVYWPDTTEFKKAMEPVYQKARETYGAETVNSILAEAAKIRG